MSLPLAQRRVMFLIVVMLILTVISVPIENVAAAGVLDQKQTLMPDASAFWSSAFAGQTFTAALTGSLTEVDLAIACYSPTGGTCATFGPVTVEIHSGSPTGTLLGSSSLGPSAFPIITAPVVTAFVAFTFSSPAVVAGSVYAIVITTNAPFGPPRYVVGLADADVYPGGTAWDFSSPPSPPVWTSLVGLDLAFETFVTPPPIPEYPLGLPLLAIFMIIAYGLVKHRTGNRKKI